MIYEQRVGLVVSSLGWVEKDSLWVYSENENKEKTISFGDAQYCTVHEGMGDIFTIAHHYEATRFRITLHSFENPENVRAQILFDEEVFKFSGDSNLWKFASQFYVEYLKYGSDANYFLIRINSEKESAEIFNMDWYDDSYDKNYQGIIGAVGIPNDKRCIISIQRSSEPIIFDTESRKKVGSVMLVGNHGNPRLRYIKKNSELWADDYDTICKINPDTFLLEKSSRVQPAASQAAQFIGSYSFNEDESLCIIPRPFSSDVVGVRTSNLKEEFTCSMDAQPLEAALLNSGKVVARDWKSGRILFGELKKKWRIF